MRDKVASNDDCRNLPHAPTVSVILSNQLSTTITILKTAALIFFLVPLIEMIILIEVGGLIGALPTVGLVVLTAISGVWLLRLEGIATLQRVQDKLNRGEVPETELLEGIMLIFGGALLLTPGFVTDTAGFICLIPGLRRPLASKIIGNASFKTFRMPGAPPHAGGHTIDGEFQQEGTTSQQVERREHP